MFKEERNECLFQWDHLGDILEGRPNLGDITSVKVYRLMQYTLRDVLIKRYGPETAGEIMYEAGKSAGLEFCKNVITQNLPFSDFIAELQQQLKDLRIGIFRMEKADLDKLELVLTVEEDLDCAGLPFSNETVCDYDEGFIAGILQSYTGKSFLVKEVDCWANGGRICRFEANVEN